MVDVVHVGKHVKAERDEGRDDVVKVWRNVVAVDIVKTEKEEVGEMEVVPVERDCCSELVSQDIPL